MGPLKLVKWDFYHNNTYVFSLNYECILNTVSRKYVYKENMALNYVIVKKLL